MSRRPNLAPTGRTLAIGGILLILVSPPGKAQAVAPQAPAQRTEITIDTTRNRHPISPYIYGVNFATTHQLQLLRAPLNRSGGDAADVYNSADDARNSGRDWFFESSACNPDIFEQYGDRFAALTRAAGAEPMLTLPMVGWVARLGPDRARLAGFSTLKYGPQQRTDRNGFALAGNGVAPDGSFIRNDPHDAMQPHTPEDQASQLQAAIARRGPASAGGVPFYVLGNEPGRWHDIHRDVHPTGTHADELSSRTIALGNLVHRLDPSAKVVAPEELAPAGTRESGFDQQLAERPSSATGASATDVPDRTAQTGGLDLLPWLLAQWKRAGHPVDIVSVHYYPQSGEYSDDVSEPMQLLRNRSTRALWDPAYRDIPWLAAGTALLPALRQTVDRSYYPGTPLALTEYSWGAEAHMSGATAQADLLGIFGRENLFAATRWVAPAEGSPTFLAMQLFRNYDGHGGSFGETAVDALAPDPDRVAAFASLRAADGALTVILINKQLHSSAPVSVALHGFARQGTFAAWQLAGGKLLPLPAAAYTAVGAQTTLPPQSITLLVMHGR